MTEERKRIKFVVNVPNIITLIRLLAIVPMIVLLSYWPRFRTSSFVLFLLIWLTDILDGYIARNYNQVSDFGKLFDPVVDKVFQLSTAITMTAIGRLPLWVPIYIFSRETIMILGGYILLKNYDVVVYSDIFGKMATLFYVIGFTLLFFIPKEPVWLKHIIFIPGASLSLIASINYARKNIHHIKLNKQ